jgi:quinol monooxygenase YgiN
MITYVTHMRVAAGSAAAFEAAIADMTRQVLAHEPGVIHYALSHSSDDPGLYVVIEVYRDEAAFAAHWETDYIRPSLARTRPLVEDGSFAVRRYESP